jgi:hypothetical protein
MQLLAANLNLALPGTNYRHNNNVGMQRVSQTKKALTLVLEALRTSALLNVYVCVRVVRLRGLRY